MNKETVFQAQAVSPGIAVGRVQIVHKSNIGFAAPVDIEIRPEEADQELRRFDAALGRTRAELCALRDRLKDSLSSADAGIFDAHLLLVDDKSIRNDVEQGIRTKNQSAECAFFSVVERYITAFEAIPDEYLRERAVDVRDVAGRVLFHLEQMESPMPRETDRRIIIAHDLTPSETAALGRDKVLGFAVEAGSSTSHAAILARSMQLPALVGVPHELMYLAADEKVILDGFSGRVIVHPEQRTEEAYRIKAEEANKLFNDMRSEKELAAETLDGFVVQLAANLEKVEDAATALDYGAHGVGLFRTEFLFLNDTLPDEDLQVEIYKKLLLAMGNAPVVIRTVDIGGDKLGGSFSRITEPNPFLGLRGIRLCLKEQRDLFDTQIRALLRAGVFGSLRVMIPMVSCPEEIQEVREIIREQQEVLKQRKVDYLSQLQLGAMIETPSAALLGDRIAPLVDFLSIGSNDLVQYTMAIDRGNERVSYLYQPANPAILELIRRCVRAGRENNISVAVCGQMASDPVYVPLLVGLGVNELSMSPTALGAVRRVVRALKMYEADALAATALKAKSGQDVLSHALALLRKVAPEVLDLTFS